MTNSLAFFALAKLARTIYNLSLIHILNSLMLCLLTETIIRLLQGTYASPMAPASSTAHQSAMDELFDRIISYIDDNIYDPLTIPEICEHFSLSRSALQLLFKNSVDQSPKKYINDKKLERSCQMLLENRYTCLLYTSRCV